MKFARVLISLNLYHHIDLVTVSRDEYPKEELDTMMLSEFTDPSRRLQSWNKRIFVTKSQSYAEAAITVICLECIKVDMSITKLKLRFRESETTDRTTIQSNKYS